MNDESSSADTSEELTGILRTAVEELKREPIPDAAMRQAVDRAAQRAIPAARTNRRLRRNAALGLAAAIAACIVFVVWYSRPTDLWAQVVKAVQTKPWVHGVNRQNAKFPAFESWQSMSGAIIAWRSEQSTGFADERSGISLEYSSWYHLKQKVLYRRRASSFEREMGGTGGVDLFRAIARGDGKLKSPSPDMTLNDQRHQQIKQDGRDWDEYDLILEGPGMLKLVTWTILVDPRTHLPRSMTYDYNPQKITIDFDYPDHGPADIYALGVPKDAKVWDCVPTDEVERTIAAIKTERDRFDDYHAIVLCKKPPGSATYLVWRKGTRWRVEKANDFPKTIPYATIKDEGRWLRDECAKAKFSPLCVCDGYEQFDDDFKRQIGGPARPGLQEGKAMTEFWAYPADRFGPGQCEAIRLIKKPAGGPSGSILLTMRATEWPPNKLWLDPTRNLATVQTEFFVHSWDGPSSWRAVVDSWKQTPKSIWYPTYVTETNPVRTDSFQFFLEFGTEMPDSLFKPEKRTVFLDRYPVK